MTIYVFMQRCQCKGDHDFLPFGKTLVLLPYTAKSWHMIDGIIYFRKCTFTKLILALHPPNKHMLDQPGCPFCWWRKTWGPNSSTALSQLCLLTSVKDCGSKSGVHSPGFSVLLHFEFSIFTAYLPTYLPNIWALCKTLEDCARGVYDTNKSLS